MPANAFVSESAHNPISNKPPLTNSIRLAGAPKPENVNTSRPAPITTATKPSLVTTSLPATNFTVETLPAEPALKAAQDAPGRIEASPNTGAVSQANSSVTNQSASKRSLLQRLNPVNLFAGDSKPASATPLTNVPSASENASPEGSSSTFPRYAYRSLRKPAHGNRPEAERSFAQGVQAQQTQHLNEAIPAYRRAIQIDPSYFDAYYNLGLAASETGNLAMALSAYESALAIKPDSTNARYNFALSLKQGNYCSDAARELEQLLRREPNDSRAHLALGNLYAQQFQQPAMARAHYMKVLENDPRNPQAGAIRYWLTDNPQ
jgi:tetratricopeptide (TPR) repeat protein